MTQRKSKRLQPFPARCLGLRPSRFGQLSKALACCGTQLSRFGSKLGCFPTALLRPSCPLRSRDLGPGRRTHLSTPTGSSNSVSAAQNPGKFTLEGFDFVFNVSRMAQLTDIILRLVASLSVVGLSSSLIISA